MGLNFNLIGVNFNLIGVNSNPVVKLYFLELRCFSG